MTAPTQTPAWETDRRAEWMPGPGTNVEGTALYPGSDPRLVGYVRVGDLVVDQTVQRGVPAARIERLANNWDWDRAEVPTVRMRPDNSLVVLEGQNRVLALQHRDPDIRIWVIVSDAVAEVTGEAGVALGITIGRRSHSSLERWNLRVRGGSVRENLAENVFTALGVRLVGGYKSANTIVAISTLESIIGTGTPEEGADLLRDVLSVLKESFTDEDVYRFDALLMRALREIIKRNPGIVDFARLKTILRGKDANGWLRFADSGVYPSPSRNVAEAVMNHYNRAKKQNLLAWALQR